MTKRAFIFGSPYWNNCPKTVQQNIDRNLYHVIDNIIHLGHMVSVADSKPANGIDAKTIKYLDQKNYNNVVIGSANMIPQQPMAAYHMPEGKWQYEHPDKNVYAPTYTYNTESIRNDRHLVDHCNYGIGVIDQKSNFNRISENPIRNMVRLMDQKQHHPDQYDTCYLISRHGNQVHQDHLNNMQDLDNVIASYRDPQTTKQYNLIKQEEIRRLHPDQYNQNFKEPSTKTKLLMTFDQNHDLSYRAKRDMVDHNPAWNQADFKPTWNNMIKAKDPTFQKMIKDGLNAKTWQQAINNTDRAVKIAKQEDIAIIDVNSPQYPQKLKTTWTKNYPNVIYAKGDLNALNTKHAAAIVGTTNPYHKNLHGEELPSYKYGAGAQRADQYSQYLGAQGYAIVTGLAAGIDTIATRGALKQNAPTIAIISNPLEQGVYPYKNQNLYNELSQDKNNHGVVISTELPGSDIPFYDPGKRALYNKSKALVARDEWQSGTSDVTIGIEENAYTNKKDPTRYQPGGTHHAMDNSKKQGRIVAAADFNNYFGKGHIPQNFSYTQAQVDQFKVQPLTNCNSLDGLMQQIESKKQTKEEKLEHDHELF